MANAMNICLVSREFPPDTAYGGIATFSLDTALILQAHGHDVTVFSQSVTGPRIMNWQGLTVHKINVPHPFRGPRRLPVFILAFNLLVLRRVIRCHLRKPFDLIDAPDHLAEGLFATLLPRIPLVTRLHTPYALLVEMGLNNYKKGLSYWLIKIFEKIAFRRSDVFYAPTRDIVRRCEELFSLKDLPAKIFGYPLDLDMFSPSPEPAHPGGPRILFMSRLEQRKGIETMGEAFPQIRAQYPDATLTIVGRDMPNMQGFRSGREYLQSVFARTGCSDGVTFVNHVSLQELPEILHAHDIVWIPSMYDNYPLVCLEAMACGKPVVVSDAGGLPEMVQHEKTGLIFPTGDPDALAQQTLRLCTSPELRAQLGKNARAYCEASCSEESIYRENIKLYEHALIRSNKEFKP